MQELHWRPFERTQALHSVQSRLRRIMQLGCDCSIVTDRAQHLLLARAPEAAMTHPQSDLVTPEVLEKIRSENQRLLQAAQTMEARIETGRLAEAIFIASELGRVLREHVFLVDGVLDVLTPDDQLNR
ncbi:MAG: hypothetical protein KJO40_04815 [Deltaproteobacteria bacterium]|nr:hypothetical protein [Deltaproteobacteria bacterium]NND27827.1 hypothetical protein [Myxococcales bacterium]MBT8464681.1 hypothetical protein [Deltaproteobacteria bacterium]MBT8482438.1 hypothetical protein [Deltaproteobacteria bacterium]NNK06307.1 hypothetical protein [Myxococcales bacterium]